MMGSGAIEDGALDGDQLTWKVALASLPTSKLALSSPTSRSGRSS